MTPAVHRVGAELRADPRRVVARLFLPGEELARGRSRVDAVIERVMALPEETVERLSDDLLRDFAGRHRNYPALLRRHADAVDGHLPAGTPPLTEARTMLLGASFTMEYAVEGAALCNPSPVPHPDQTGLGEGQLRVALSLRAVGEGHVSSIGFATAVVGPGPVWAAEPRVRPAVTGTVGPAAWSVGHLRAVLADRQPLDQLAHSTLRRLPDPFTSADLQTTLDALVDNGLRHGGRETADLLRLLAGSSYTVEFPADTRLSQRVLVPVAAEERNGIEDARFVLVTAADGSTEYRATWTAYDGRQIAPRLLTSPDLRTFRTDRLAGPAARNKGMALFPRLVAGRHLALCRSDGESTSLASSVDGLVWSDPVPLQQPCEPWELVQIGNCGSPLETPEGWLVLTHGVGPMRTYSLGALLLDLDDPTKVLRRLREPLLSPAADEVEGYVPHVVYTCGGLVHDGRLWIPFGIGDVRIDVAHVDVAELIAAMV